MPFKSEKQRRYMFANEPEIAKNWVEKYATGGMKRKSVRAMLTKPQSLSRMAAGGMVKRGTLIPGDTSEYQKSVCKKFGC